MVLKLLLYSDRLSTGGVLVASPSAGERASHGESGPRERRGRVPPLESLLFLKEVVPYNQLKPALDLRLALLHPSHWSFKISCDQRQPPGALLRLVRIF